MGNKTYENVKKMNVPNTIALFLTLERKKGKDSGSG